MPVTTGPRMSRPAATLPGPTAPASVVSAPADAGKRVGSAATVADAVAVAGDDGAADVAAGGDAAGAGGPDVGLARLRGRVRAPSRARPCPRGSPRSRTPWRRSAPRRAERRGSAGSPRPRGRSGSRGCRASVPPAAKGVLLPGAEMLFLTFSFGVPKLQARRVGAYPGSHPSGAISKPANSNPGATTHETSVHSPRLSAACQASFGTTACGRSPDARSGPSTAASAAPPSAAISSVSGAPACQSQSSVASTRCQRERWPRSRRK